MTEAVPIFSQVDIKVFFNTTFRIAWSCFDKN